MNTRPINYLTRQEVVAVLRQSLESYEISLKDEFRREEIVAPGTRPDLTKQMSATSDCLSLIDYATSVQMPRLKTWAIKKVAKILAKEVAGNRCLRARWICDEVRKHGIDLVGPSCSHVPDK